MSRINLKKSLRVALKEKGLKRDSILQVLGCKHRSSITHLLNNPNSSIGTWDKIAEFFGYKLWEFIKLGDA